MRKLCCTVLSQTYVAYVYISLAYVLLEEVVFIRIFSTIH